MATITAINIHSTLIVTVSGEATTDEMVAIVREYYTQGVIKDVIWDFSSGSMKPFANEIKDLIEAVKTSMAEGGRSGGKTVFVRKSPEDHKLLCLYSIMAESAQVPVEYYVCGSMAEAYEIVEKT